MLSAMLKRSPGWWEVGLTPPEVTNTLPHRQCRRFFTVVAASPGIHHRPRRIAGLSEPSPAECAAASIARTGFVESMFRAPAVVRISRPSIDREIQHPAGILANPVFNPGRRNVVAIASTSDREVTRLCSPADPRCICRPAARWPTSSRNARHGWSSFGPYSRSRRSCTGFTGKSTPIKCERTES